MKNNFLGKLLLNLWGLLLAISIILSSLSIAISSKSQDRKYFHDFQVENNIVDVTNRTQEELDTISQDLTSYLQIGKDSLLEKHFNQKEVAHMRDVFDLYELNRKVNNIALTFVILSLVLLTIKKLRRSVFSICLKYLFGILIFSAFIGLIISFDFNKYFVMFHEVFFDNDLWLLDPNTDLMIQMLPIDFFIGIALRIFTLFLTILGTIMIAMGIEVYVAKKKNKECGLCNTMDLE